MLVTMSRKCPICRGSGKVLTRSHIPNDNLQIKTCKPCNGTGRIEYEENNDLITENPNKYKIIVIIIVIIIILYNLLVP